MFEDTDEDTEDLDLFERSRPPRMSDLNYLTQVVEAGFRTTAEAAQRKGGRSGLDLAAARPRGDAIRAVERLCAAPPGEGGGLRADELDRLRRALASVPGDEAARARG